MKTDRVLRPWPPELYLFGFFVLFEIKKDVVVEMAVGELGGHHK